MSEGIVVLVIGGCWLIIGLALAIEMGRRGYETYGWAVLGAVVGPFAIVLAIDAVRHKDEAPPWPRASRGRPTSGPASVGSS